MSLKEFQIINKESFVSEIVKNDYRTATVFRRYGIEYCCGARLPLEMVCSLKDLDAEKIRAELDEVRHTICLPSFLKIGEWDLSFLADYIVNVHHAYLKTIFPAATDIVKQFAEGHEKKYRYLSDLTTIFSALSKELTAHIKHEEEIIFPYIRQIAHAHKTKGAYAKLLVRTLSKPVEEVMNHEHQFVMESLSRIRELTNHYTIPENACISHRVSFLTMQEIDNDIIQHLHLENDILFPGAIRMEKELLKNNYL